MKKIKVIAVLLSLASVLFAACNNEEDNTLYHVRLSVDDFQFYDEGFEKLGTAKAIDTVATTSAIAHLIVAVYDSTGNVIKSTKQSNRTDTNSRYYTSSFGVFNFLLPAGRYTVIAIGYKSSDPENLQLLDSSQAAFTTTVLDCFGDREDIIVSKTAINNISITLKRLVAGLSLHSTDNQPEGFDTIRLDLSKGSMRFNPSTGFALDNIGTSRRFALNANTTNNKVGVPLKIIIYTFLEKQADTMDFSFTLFSQDSTGIVERVIPNVPLKQNRRTVARGRVFSSIDNEFLIETDWEGTDTIPF